MKEIVVAEYADEETGELNQNKNNFVYEDTIFPEE